MAAIIAFVGAINQHAAPPGQYRIAGVAEVEGGDPNLPVSWEAFVGFTSQPITINQACIDAAVAAAVAAGFVVGPSDAKTLFASAVLG